MSELKSINKNRIVVKVGTITITNGYMFKLAKLTGMRAAELSSLKKEDIDFDLKRIHVHSQQLKIKETLEYAYADYTKNERGNAQGGRYVPLLPEAEKYLKEHE